LLTWDCIRNWHTAKPLRASFRKAALHQVVARRNRRGFVKQARLKTARETKFKQNCTRTLYRLKVDAVEKVQN
jgi:hypothetical protein